MAETAAKITILGLDLVGTSIGLSLRQEAGNYQVMGHDREPSRMNQAKKQGGIDSSSWNLHRACDGASLVIITEPLSQLPETLEHIHEDIAEDAVIFSIGPVMQPALDIAADNLPNHINFVAGRPVHNDFGSPPEPRSDLLKESTFCIGAAPGTKSTALELVSNLLARLGAKPLYIDSLEHDGIVAAVEQLPELLAAALFQTAYDAPGWHESQKLAGRRFALSTGMEATPAEMAATLFTNRDMLLQRLDQLSTLLETWRTHLSAEDAKPLEEQLDGLIEGRAKWERDAKLRDWDRTMEPTSRGEVGGLGQMLFGSYLYNRAKQRDPGHAKKDTPSR